MNRLYDTSENVFRGISYFLLAVATILAFIPFVLIMITSITQEKSLLQNGYSFFPKQLSLNAYGYLFANKESILQSYFVSFSVTLIGTVVSLLLTTMLAYPMSRKDFRYGNLLAFIVFFTMLFSGGIVPSYMMWTRIFHINDSIWALIVPTYLLSGFNVMLVRNYYTNHVPVALIESAHIDGASELRTFVSIMLPLSLPVIATVGLFTGLAYWNDWINALYYVTKPQYFGIQNLLLRMMNNIQYLATSEARQLLGAGAAEVPGTAIRMAMAVIGILPILIIFPFIQKFLTRGIVIGAVKG